MSVRASYPLVAHPSPRPPLALTYLTQDSLLGVDVVTEERMYKVFPKDKSKPEGEEKTRGGDVPEGMEAIPSWARDDSVDVSSVENSSTQLLSNRKSATAFLKNVAPSSLVPAGEWM